MEIAHSVIRIVFSSLKIMKTIISIRLSEPLTQAMLKNARALHLSQADYIRKAIEFMNDGVEKKRKAERLIKASLRVRKASMKINAEFDMI